MVFLNNYTDTAEIELTELTVSEALRTLSVGANQLDDEGMSFEIVHNDRHIAIVKLIGNRYRVLDRAFVGIDYDSPEVAALAWVEREYPVKTLTAIAEAYSTVLDRQQYNYN